MAFAGDFGAAANLVPFGLIFTRRWGLAVGYDAGGNIQFQPDGAGGEIITPQRVDGLFISGANDILAALVDNTDDGSAADTGVLVTAAAAANQHGLPANFGPGRGNWVDPDNAFDLDVRPLTQRNTVAAATNTGGPVLRAIAVAGGDLTLAFKNMSEVALANATLLVRMVHSIQE